MQIDAPLAQYTLFKRKNCCQGFPTQLENMENKKKIATSKLKKLCRKANVLNHLTSRELLLIFECVS